MTQLKRKVSSVEEDTICIDSIRVFCAEMVQKANSGHPGAPMGCAPMAHALFSKHISYCANPRDYWNRDRFILSNGHACALLYTMLHLTNQGNVTVDDLANFRQLGSVTAGHPERHLLEGVEVSTGPLGQGISSAVGIAIASKWMASNFNRGDKFQLFNNNVYVICGDGCLMEGVSYEACAIAGHLKLGNLICLFDDNGITIDGKTSLTTSECIRGRFEAQGWEYLTVERGDDSDLEDLHAKIATAKKSLDKPTIIAVKTTIGFGAFSKSGSHKVHGSPLGAEELQKTKDAICGGALASVPSLSLHSKVYDLYSMRNKEMEQRYLEWRQLLDSYRIEYADDYDKLKKFFSTTVEDDALSKFKEDALNKSPSKDSSTRQYSSDVLRIASKHFENILGGSADLAPSNLVNVLEPRGGDFQPGSYDQRYIRFGVREHAMSSIANGIASYGSTIPMISTFLNFVGYCWGGLRLSALNQLRVIFVATHDSIELGEDGPTHQPIEILPLIRATPNINLIRPADYVETVAAYSIAISSTNTPSVLALSRGACPNNAGSSLEGAMMGGYVLYDFGECTSAGESVVLVASGTEVALARASKKALESENIRTRVVSMPCLDIFKSQDAEYQRKVLNSSDNTLVFYIEASGTLGMDSITPNVIGMTSFGASGPSAKLMSHFGFTVDNVCEQVRRKLRE